LYHLATLLYQNVTKTFKKQVDFFLWLSQNKKMSRLVCAVALWLDWDHHTYTCGPWCHYSRWRIPPFAYILPPRDMMILAFIRVTSQGQSPALYTNKSVRQSSVTWWHCPSSSRWKCDEVGSSSL